MMKNFVLLENEHDHTGSDRNGPLAAFDDAFKGRDYFHVRRVYRGVGGAWSPSGQGFSCPLDQKGALLAALRAYLYTEATTLPGEHGMPVKARNATLLAGGTIEHTTAKL